MGWVYEAEPVHVCDELIDPNRVARGSIWECECGRRWMVYGAISYSAGRTINIPGKNFWAEQIMYEGCWQDAKWVEQQEATKSWDEQTRRMEEVYAEQQAALAKLPRRHWWERR